MFREVVGLERGPLSLVSTIEELLEGEISGSCEKIFKESVSTGRMAPFGT
jgi:hypothetical protein